MPDENRQQNFNEFAGKYRARLIEGVAAAYGNKARDAETLSPQEELRLYRMPTSDAALRVFQMGGTLQDAERANAMMANEMKGRADQIRTAGLERGMSSDEIAALLAEQQLTDEAIFAQTRKHAYRLGKQNGHNDAAQEVDYHGRMTKRLQEQRASEGVG